MTWSQPATSLARLHFQTRVHGSVAAMRRTRSFPITIAARSRPARSTGRSSRSAGSRSPFDLLAIQIEGSGRVILEDGTPLRVNYDSHNGYAFSSLERVLIETQIISRKEISTQRIRDWMTAHPDEAAESARRQPLLHVLPRYRAFERGRTDRRAGCAVDAGPVHCR